MKNIFIMKNNQVIDATDCSAPQLVRKTNSNRVAAWRAQRNASESEASRLIRLDRQSDARTAQRRNRSQQTPTTEHCSSFEDNANNKIINEILEKNTHKLDNQSRQQNKLRKVQRLEERQKQLKITLYHEVSNTMTDWCSPQLVVRIHFSVY